MHVSVRAGLRLSGSAIAVIAAWNASIAQEPPRTTVARAGDAPRRAPAAPETTAPQTTGPQTNIPQITVTAPKETPTDSAHGAPRRPPRRAATPGACRRTAAAPARRRPLNNKRPPPAPSRSRSRRSNQNARKHPAEDRNRRNAGHEPGDQQRAGRSQPVGQRHSGDPVSRRLSGFDIDRRLSRAQRARQRAVSHQRHHPARRRFRVRPVPRDELHRQDGARHRRAAGPIRAAQHRHPRHHIEGLHHQSESGLDRRLWRQPGHDHADVRIWRQGPARPSISSPPANSRTSSASRTRPPNATALHDFTTRGGFFGYTSTYLDDWTRISTITGAQTIKYQIPTNPGQPVFPGLFPIFGAPADRRRFRQDQRGAIREERLWRARLAAHHSAISTCSSPTSRATTACCSCPISTATSSSTVSPPTSIEARS